MADWRVDVQDDDVNTGYAVTYLLHRHCGMTLADAAAAMARVHIDVSGEVGRFADQDTAEQLAVLLQMHGLHATVLGIPDDVVGSH